MRRMVQTVAVGAALSAVAVGVWRDYEPVATLQRAVGAYLAAYFAGGLVYLAGRAALRGVEDPPPPPAAEDAPNKSRRQRTEASRRPPPAAVEPAAAESRTGAP